MQNNSSVLLLTACIHPKDNGGNLKFYEIREKQYEDALKYYIYNSKFTHIVFVDNSNYILEYIKNLKTEKNNIYHINNKDVEYLSFNGNKFIEQYKYGYCEEEIIDYALDNSIFLQNLKKDESFFKITGRYIIKNIDHLINTSPKELFFRGVWGFPCITALFKIKKETFMKYLYEKVKDFYVKFSKGNFITLETVYYIQLREHLFKNTKTNPPIFIFFYLNDGSIRHAIPKINNNLIVKIIYGFFSLLTLNQFGFLAKVIDKIFFARWFKRSFG